MTTRFRAAPAILILLALVGCAPGAPPTPTAQQVAEIASAAFPGAEIVVGDVAREETDVDARARARAELDGTDVVLVLEAASAAWAVVAVEQGEVAYTVEELGRVRTTIMAMRALSDGLGAYHEARAEFPLLDDLVGLRQLVPDYYGGDDGFADGWGNPFRYRVQGQDYTLTSSGPDGVPATADDIILITGSFQGAE